MRRPSVLDGQRVTPRARPALHIVRDVALELPALAATAPRDGWRRTRALGVGLAVVVAATAIAAGLAWIARRL